MKKLVYILIAVCLLFGSYCYTQPVTQEWVRRYNEPGNMNDHTTSLALDKQGNVCVTGYCETATQSTNIVTLKYTPTGAQQWVASFNYTGNVADEPHAMVIDTAGNIYVAGSSGSFLTQIYDCVLVKYNPAGTLLWSRGYGGFTGAFYTNDLILDRQGSIYIVGTTNVPSGNSVFLLKYNSNGDTLWTRKYKEPGYDLNAGMSIAVDSLNNVLIGGQCVVNINYAGDCLLIKYTSTGNYLWSQIYNSGGVNTSDIIYKVGNDNNGNVYGTGKTNYFSDMLTLKYNATGINQWIKIYNGYDNGSDYGAALAIDLASNIYVTGGSVGGPSFTSDFITIKYNTNGDSQWVRRYNGTGNSSDLARDICLDDSSNVYIVGISAGTTGNDITTLKYTSQGTQQWVMRYPGLPSQFFFGKKMQLTIKEMFM